MPAKLMPATWADLERSGLLPATVEAAAIKDEATDDDVGALLRDRFHVSGFVIPYHGLDRQQSKFYRVKVLQSLNGAKPPKYLQPKATTNHIYIPPGLYGLNADWVSDPSVDLYITEGEKKALAGVQLSIPTVAVGGVFSWRTHIHTLERGVVRVEDKPSARVVYLDERGEKAYRTQVAPELEEIEWGERNVYLIFDSDATNNSEVQRAAFEFANWLDERGADTKQISLVDRIPLSVLESAGRDPAEKLGLDDVLGLDPAFSDNLLDPEWREAESFRPLPSDPLEWVTDQLNTGRTPRDTQERVARFAINWLDANGTRFMGVDGTYYYFDNETRILHDFILERGGITSIRETSFGHLLMEQLGLDPVDASTMGRLIGHYPLGAAIIHPHRVLAIEPEGHPDQIYYQVSDADVMRIDSDGLELISNGDDDVLFYKGMIEPVRLDRLEKACEAWRRGKEPLWYEALSTLNVTPLPGFNRDQTLKLLTCLFYMSPWLNRWRGTMMPLEIAVAEPNSGKSFTYNLRKGVLTGRTSLSGLPGDFKDWTAIVGAAPSIWVCDNLGNVRQDYWHRLNDELARLITDPSPSIEMRQLFTTATTYKVPINATFAITTIRNPFNAPDVLQRSIVYQLNAIPVGKRDPDWYTDRMKKRLSWMAEHLNVLHLFLEKATKEWKANYKSGYRLVHFEQSVMIMGQVLGWDMSKIVAGLPDVVAATIAAYDPVMEAMLTFVDEWPHPRRRVILRQVVDWVEMDPGERFTALRQFANEITLAKYINAHRYDIEQSTGVKIIDEQGQLIIMLPGGKR